MLARAAAQAAGVGGLLFRVSRSDGAPAAGKARVTVDYSTFWGAYGADWSGRLRLSSVPECALTSPQATGCEPTPLESENRAEARTVSADVEVAPAGTLLALAAAPKGNPGDYSATSLSSSAAWTAGGNTGDFSWSYPMRVPPSLGGPSPTVALNYSSASVDGRMPANNNQPSWVGEGFDFTAGFIERRYRSCADDKAGGNNSAGKDTYDQCWATDNALLSMSGHAGDLIKDTAPRSPESDKDPKVTRWHLRADDGTYIERRLGAGNGARDGEHWVVTTTDGTRYWFGRGAASTLTVPVYGNHPDEPCHAAEFKDSACAKQTVYRWQLDYVEDTDGNTMTYSYVKEKNKYGRNGSTTDLVEYDRAGYLQKIEYGTRVGGSGAAPMQVIFDVDDRCLAACTVHDAAHWPDVPWEQECTKSPCTNNAPTFWTTRRLSRISTHVLYAGKTKPTEVESWTFTHSFPMAGEHPGRAVAGQDRPRRAGGQRYQGGRCDIRRCRHGQQGRRRPNGPVARDEVVPDEDDQYGDRREDRRHLLTIRTASTRNRGCRTRTRCRTTSCAATR